MIPDKYKLIIAGTEYSKIYFLFFSSIVVLFLEMLGIGSVPIFALIIVDTEGFLKKIAEYTNYDINFDIDKKQLVIISGAIFLGIFVIKNIILGLISYLQFKIIQILKFNGEKKLYQYFIKSPYTFFLNTNPAVMTRSLESDMSYTYGYFLAKIKLLRESILVVIILLSLILIDPLIYSVSFLLLMIATLLFYLFYRKVLKHRAILLREMTAEKFKIINQTFNSIKEVKIMNKEDFFSKNFNNVNDTVQRVQFVNNFVTSLPRLVYESIAIFSIIFLTILLFVLEKPDQMILPIVSLLVASGARFIPAFNVITTSMSTIRFMQPSFDNITERLKALRDQEKSHKEKNLKEKINGRKVINFSKNIKIDGISFSYSHKKNIDNLSLTIEKGQTIGIIGASGEGKSTLINIILGLLSPEKGNILVDNINVERNLTQWQSKIGYIPQDIYLIDDTIKQNICFGIPSNEIDEDQFKKVLINSELDNFVRSLPEKELTEVGNVGIRISGGQKQRIAIARALLQKPKLLILDEATSEINSSLEKKILSNICNHKELNGIIIISHNVRNKKIADQYLEIVNNNILERNR